MQRAQDTVFRFHCIDQRPSERGASPARNQAMGTDGVDIRPQTNLVVDGRIMAFERKQQWLSRHGSDQLQRDQIWRLDCHSSFPFPSPSIL
ncbi:MAG: hypothetical protein WDM87_15865 [Terracidiphilus sp.]